MIPDYDPDAATADPSAFACTVADVQAGMPFAGALFRLDDDDEREWLTAYTPEEPGRLTDVAGEYGAGTYVVRTLTGYPKETVRELEVVVGGRRRRSGKAPDPRMEANAFDQISTSIRQEAGAAASAEFDTQRRALEGERETAQSEARRARLDAQEATDRADRIKRELDDVAATVQRLRQDVADAQRDAAVARQDKADAQLQYARDLAAEERKHLNELTRLRDQVSTLTADARVAAMELRMAQNGEGADIGDRIVGLLESASGPILTAISQQRMAQNPAAPANGTFAPAHAGDGHASEAYAPAFAAPPAPPAIPWPSAPPTPATDARPDDEKGVQGAAPVDDGDSLGAVYRAAEAALTGAEDALGVPAFTALVERTRREADALGIETPDWKALGGDVLALAIDHATAPDTVAAYLAPLVEPFRSSLTFALGMPQGAAAKMVAVALDLVLDAAGTKYLGRVVRALKVQMKATA